MKNTLKYGDRGQNVVLLQQYLTSKGFLLSIDGIYGKQTKNAVQRLQLALGQSETGIADENLIHTASQPTIIDSWALAIKSREGFIAPCHQYPQGTPAWRNNNPGNLRIAGSFVKYPTYQDGWNALKNLILRACTGQSKIYNPEGTLRQFFEGVPPYKQFPGYAPASDHNDPKSYAKFVADEIKVDMYIKIKDILNL